MKKDIIYFLLMLICCFSFIDAKVEEQICVQSEEAVREALYGHIDAKGLKALIDSQTSFVLLDARGRNWHDVGIIIGAKLASNEYSFEEIEQIIPHSDSLVVVYCFTSTCPLGNRLIDKLIEYGYTNIVKYPGGLKEWRDVAYYPVEFIQE